MKEKLELDFKRKIKLGNSSLHGRGVFATEDIEPDEIVERCPLKIMGFRMNYHKDPVIWSHMYTHSCPCDECKRHGGHFLMIMGYAQIYNHQDDQNADIKFDLKNEIADIICVRRIEKGEEIFVNYGSSYFKNREKIDLSKKNNDSLGSVFDQAKSSPNSCTTQVFNPV
jgi:hypothetical protein